MKNTVQIRPEQAARLLALNAEASATQARFVAAAQAVLAGLIDTEARIESISSDGTVTLLVPEKEE